MSLGNIWLGSMVLATVSGSQSLATNSCNVETVVQAAASVMDWVMVANVGTKASDVVQISIRPVEGTAYCSVIYSGTLTDVASVFYQPTRPLFLYPSDQVVVHIPNASLTGTANVSMRTLM